MATTSEDLFTSRKSLDQVCSVLDKIISVYSLEQHVWADKNSAEARKERRPELQTIDEFQIDPVRPFLNDILRNMAAPYKPERKENPIGQGYWIQAEFGSGKSHLLCFLSALALGDAKAWDLVAAKEQKTGRGKRESLYRFWEEGLKAKAEGSKGVFVIVTTLVGRGSGTVGVADSGRALTEYIIDAAKDQVLAETGKNLSLYPVELLADRFLSTDLERYTSDLRKFLRDPQFFSEDEYEDLDKFIADIQQNKSPEYKRSCGNKLWRFYTEYLAVQPHIPAEPEDILKHLVETIMGEGYCGVLLVLDEVSLFMKDRDDQRNDDERTLVVLSNRLAKTHNLPIWTVCSAQQAIESKMGAKNIIADDRLKLVKLLENDKDYYDIVLARVREVKDPAAISAYYAFYKRGFTWPNSIGETEFAHFFPFHKPALEVLRAVTYELTTARSAIHFMHQTLKHQIKNKGRELVRLWELFDEAVRYEEDPSGVHSGLVAIKTKKETEYKAYEACKTQIDGITKGFLKVYHDKAVNTLQTLFLYHISRTRQQGISPEEIANSVLVERDANSTPDENIQHYETMAENLKKELAQVAQTFEEDGKPRYRFDPILTGVRPQDEFQKARGAIEGNEALLNEAWEHLLALDEWPVRTRQMTIDLSNGVKSVFRDVAPFVAPWEARLLAKSEDEVLQVRWLGREVCGHVRMRDLAHVVSDNLPLHAIATDETDDDFGFFISSKPVTPDGVNKLIARTTDPRVVFWTPAELNSEEQGLLLDFAAYRKLVSDWQGKNTEDSNAVISWVADSLQTDMGRIKRIVDSSYGRGRMDAVNNTQMGFHVAGELTGVIEPIVARVLAAAYESQDIRFDHQFTFTKDEGVKVINGIVKTGNIPKNAKPNKDISAAQNFGYGLMIMKKSAEKDLDYSGNSYVDDIWDFIDTHLSTDTDSMPMATICKNFMGIGGPKDYGLTRRMVQIFLLCLVRGGKIRLTVGPKSGLPEPVIDYSSIAGIEFSAKVLDSLTGIQKMSKPENWEVLRPYAEVLLSEQIQPTHDDAAISAYRARLRDLFATEKDISAELVVSAKDLFDYLKVANPYENEVAQVAKLFSHDVSGGNDINAILFALKDAFGYQAFDTTSALQTEVDDLANRVRNYRDVQRFAATDARLRSAYVYAHTPLPDLEALKQIRALQQKLGQRLQNIQPYVDSDVKLKTELLGKMPAEPSESGTFGALVRDYTNVYISLHDSVLTKVGQDSGAIAAIADGDEMKALRILENVNALLPAVSGTLEEQMAAAIGDLFGCPAPSMASIKDELKHSPAHQCGLTFMNSAQMIADADAAAGSARSKFDAAVDRKVEVFLNPEIRKRLEQGKADPVIAGLLGCNDVAQLRAYLFEQVLADEKVVDVINRYLKKIVRKVVKLTDFDPSTGTVAKEQIAQVADEFQKFLEEQLAEVKADEDTLPVLQLE